APVPPGPPVAPLERPLEDVWSRTEPKYRVRAFVLLALNLALYSGLCAFAFWLHTGELSNFAVEAYLSPARLWGATGAQQSLTDFVLSPISVLQTPLHGVVLGLLLAAIIATPITVAILYRTLAAIPFVLATAVFAHLPWMAFTLTFSALLVAAALRRMRFRFRFAVALLGLVPVVVYLALATRGGAEKLLSTATPSEAALIYGVWVVSIVGAAVGIALVLTLAKIVDYRPGAVAPVMGLMAAVPTTLFFQGVGPDELSYRVLEARLAPIVVEGPAGRPTGASYLAERAAASIECERFLADYPTSRFVPCALYLEGIVNDLRIAPDGARYSAYPRMSSEPAWASLFTNYPESPLSVSAGVRLAALYARQGRVEEALQAVNEVERRAVRLMAEAPFHARTILAPTPAESNLKVDLPALRVEGRQWRELIVANYHDARYGSAPLIAFAGLDSHRDGYVDQLKALIAQYSDSLLVDNLLVRWVETIQDARTRRIALRRLVKRPDGDARVEAAFRLADLEIQSLGDEGSGLRLTGLTRMRSVAKEHSETAWGLEASRRLSLFAESPE
ncbi:MAG: hypothetical protein KDA32_09795, partial [Phycisphaerales bacterium]|nr:hypothetical protein [Phycisphaerales bacterium]